MLEIFSIFYIVGVLRIAKVISNKANMESYQEMSIDIDNCSWVTTQYS